MKTPKRLLNLPLTLTAVALIVLAGCSKDEEEEFFYDQDGTKYAVAHIGGHYWMKENLRALHFSDGSGMLVGLPDDYEWASAGPACCIYDPDEVEGIDDEDDMRLAYGVLYNWYAVTSSSGLCPVGWRIPTNEDWEELIAELGGMDVAGGKMKSKRTVPEDHPRWESPNTGATNEDAFRALPAGCRTSLGEFFDLGWYAMWWTSTEYDPNFAYSWYIPHDGAYIDYSIKKKRTGYAVRCIKE